MVITKASRHDLIAIQDLLLKYPDKPMQISADFFNHRDIALQARLETGELVGFLWCGVMAKGRIGWVECVLVHPEHQGKGIAKAMDKALLSECSKRGIKQVFGTIKHDKYHDRMAVAHLKSLAGKCIPGSFTIMYTDIEKASEELRKLGA